MEIDRRYSTTDLIQIIERERSACLRGERLLLKDHSPTGNAAIDYFLNQEGSQRYTAFQNFRAAIHSYQQQYEVSGLIWETIEFQDCSLQYPKIAPDLIALSADLQVLQNYFPMVFNFWQKAIVDLDLYWELTGKRYQRIQPNKTIALLDEESWASLTLWSSSTGSTSTGSTSTRFSPTDFLEFILDVYSIPGSPDPPESPNPGNGKPIQLQDCNCLSLHAVFPGTYPIG